MVSIGGDDGTIIIRAEVDTKGVEKGVVEIKRETAKLKDIKLELNDEQMKDAIKSYADGIIEEIGTLMEEYNNLTSGPILFGDDLQRAEQIKLEVQAWAKELETIYGTSVKLPGFTDEVKEDVSAIKKLTSGIGNGIEKVSKKMGRIALSLIGIRSLYGMISSSMSRITSNNAEIKADIDALNSSLDEIIGRLVEALLPLLELIVGIVEFIAVYLFGVDLSSKRFSNNMKDASKSATKLRKQLMGFDEMNILNEDGSVGALGNLVGADTTKEKNYIKGAEKTFQDQQETFNDFMDNLVGTTSGPKALTEKYKYYLDDIEKYLKESDIKIEDGWVTIMHEGAEAVKMTTVEYRGLQEVLKTRVVQNTLRAKQLDKIIKASGIGNKIAKDLKKNLKSIANFGTETSKDFKKFFDLVKYEGLQIMDDFTGTYENGMWVIKTKTGETFRLTQTEWDNVVNFIVNRMNGLENKGKTSAEAIQRKIKQALDETKTNVTTTDGNIVSNITDTANTIKSKVDEIVETNKKGANDSKNAWTNGFSNIGSAVQQSANNLVDTISEALKKPQIVGSYDQTANGIVKSTEDALKEVTKTINNYNFPTKKIKVEPDTSNFLTKLKTAINNSASALALAVQLTIASTGGKKGAKGLMINAPRLASGGIINRPGRGVAIGGERGREAVIPLTDSQQMALLGQEIGKNVTIVATIPVSVGNRQVAREVRRINAEDEFGYNGGL